MDEQKLRQLAEWSLAWDELKPVENEITQLWSRLKELRTVVKLRQTALRQLGSGLTTIEERFWSKVEIIDDDDSCWEWKSGRHPVPGEEYGIFRVSEGDFPGYKAGPTRASRFALALKLGVLPDQTRHTCDNPPCCRPTHLLDGTHQDNMRDRHVRGRYSRLGGPKGVGSRGGSTIGRGTKERPSHPSQAREQRGEANDSAVLTDAIVLEARRRGRAGETQRVIAADLGVDAPTLGYAMRGKTWSHLDAIEEPVPKRKGGTRITEDDVRSIRAQYDAVFDPTIKRNLAARRVQEELSRKYGLTMANIYAIVKRKSWAHVE